MDNDTEMDTLAALHNLCIELNNLLARAKSNGYTPEDFARGYVAGVQAALRIAQDARDEYVPDDDA
jgi:hypothetical protein